jgi:nicotinamide-nucleotide amidase
LGLRCILAPVRGGTLGAVTQQTIKRAEILTIGTELLLGETIDTNGAWLAAWLAEHGVDVLRSVRVGDNLTRMVEAIEVGLQRSDLVLTTGGLGPTDDDMTREAIAAVVGETPEVDPAQLEALEAWFEATGRTMPQQNRKQAWRVPSAQILANPNGTAPGWLVRFELDGVPKAVAALPGPPRELKPMVQGELAPRLAFPTSHLWKRTFKVGQLGESTVAEMLGDLTQQANPSVATYAKADGVHVRVAAKAASEADAQALGEPAAARVADILSGDVWGVDDDTLAGVVLRQLKARGLTLAVVDGGTGGRLLTMLHDADPDGETFKGGVVGLRDDAWRASDPASDGPRERKTEASAWALTRFAADAALVVGDVRPVDTETGPMVATVQVTTEGETNEETVRLPKRKPEWVRSRVTVQTLDLLRRRLR